MSIPIRLDLNNPVFQRQLLELETKQQMAVLRGLQRLSKMTWNELYTHRGCHWEALSSRKGPGGVTLYTMRLRRGFRAVAYRQGDWVRVLTLHRDHDSAYR